MNTLEVEADWTDRLTEIIAQVDFAPPVGQLFPDTF